MTDMTERMTIAIMLDYRVAPLRLPVRLRGWMYRRRSEARGIVLWPNSPTKMSWASGKS